MKKIVIFLILSLLLIVFWSVTRTQAASLSAISDVLSRLKVSEDANHTISFTTPTGVAAGQTITIAFPSDFDTTGVDFSDIDVTDDGTDLDLAAIPAGATWGAAFGGTGNRTLTITSGTGTIAATSAIVVEIGTHAAFAVAGDQAINNATVAGNYTITIAGTFGDTGQYAIYIVDNDQIIINGEVDPTISLAISDNQVGFGHFTNTNVRYATADETGAFVEPGNSLPTQLTASTNATSGLTISIRDEGDGANAGLWSTAASELIAADASSNVLANSKKYGVYGKNASSLTIAAGFNDDGVGDLAISRSAQTFASTAGIVSNGQVDLSAKSAIDGSTKAGSYTDTLTVICTGNY